MTNARHDVPSNMAVIKMLDGVTFPKLPHVHGIPGADITLLWPWMTCGKSIPTQE